jgi:hypothetical protein
MTEHPVIYQTFNDKFRQLNEIEAKAVLEFQFTWQDQFAKSIYQHEIKDGTIKMFYVRKVLDWDDVWAKRKFRKVIDEWENHTPILEFNSVGESLFFYKAIFHLNCDLAIRILSGNYVQNIEADYRNYLSEDPDWKYVEEFLYGGMCELIQSKKKHN